MTKVIRTWCYRDVAVPSSTRCFLFRCCVSMVRGCLAILVMGRSPKNRIGGCYQQGPPIFTKLGRCRMPTVFMLVVGAVVTAIVFNKYIEIETNSPSFPGNTAVPNAFHINRKN